MILSDLPPLFLEVLAVAFGLLWGSFLNVVIYRVPRGESVVHPPSHCPACGVPIRPWQNVPVFGWLLLRGKARCCGVPISPRYPLVEAIGGVLSLAILEVIILRLPPETSLARAGAIYVADLAFALGLVAAAFIDLDFMYLPQSITFGAAVLGIATASFRELTFVDAIVGAAVGFAVVWVPFIKLYAWIRGRVGMGLGDASLLMAAGAWFGWRGTLTVLGAGAIQGTLVALPMLLLRGRIEEPAEVTREREERQRELATATGDEKAALEKEIADDPLAEAPTSGFSGARLAFGPFLILAMLESLLGGRDLASFLARWIAPPS